MAAQTTHQIVRWRVSALKHGPNIRSDLGNEGQQRRPAPAQSDLELIETALAVGWPGAFDGLNCRSAEALVRHRLLRQSE